MFIELEAQLLERKIEIKLLPAARKYLVREGYDAALGARPISRLIAKKVKKNLSEEILFGKLTNGGRVEVGASGRPMDITLKITPSPKQEKITAKKAEA